MKIVGMLLFCLSVGCTAEIADEDGDAPIEEEVGISTDELGAARCHRHETIFPQTRDADRWIIDRALEWVDDRVMYSQVHTTDGWRQDCSGFVSMAWRLTGTKPGLVTWTMNERSHQIDWNQLRPGDALNIPHHHVFLFAGWVDGSHEELCAIEEYATGVPASITRRSRHDVRSIGYQPIRRDPD